MKNRSSFSAMSGFMPISIDAYNLEAHVRNAIEEDERYKRENAAKFRAVEQSKSYNEFRDIVNAAHLKPLEKGDAFHVGKMGSSKWNLSAKQSNITPDNCIISSISNITNLPAEDLSTANVTHRNFEKYWETYSDNTKDKIKLLHRAISNEDIFKHHELSPDLIGSIIKTLLESVEINSNLLMKDEHFELALNVLESISTAPRFYINLLFLKNEEKLIIKCLLKKLNNFYKNRTDNDALSHYGNVLQTMEKFRCWDED